MRGLATLLVLSLLLAGCSGNGDPSAKVEVPQAFQEPVDVANGKGVLRGLVITPAIVPVPGATIQLVSTGQNKTSDADGAFVFTDLEPGNYFLSVSKPGWTSIQQSAEVVADVPDPDIVKIAIERLPGSEPRAETLHLEGFIACSYGTPLTYDSCAVAGQEETSDIYFDIQGVPSYIQTEIVWESTQPSGDWLYVIQGICSCDGGVPPVGGARFDEVPDATSVYVAGTNATWLNGNGIGTDDGKQLVISMSASGPEPETTNGSGIALNQAFEVYATFFYNIPEPMEGWTFSSDGPYPVPASDGP